MELVELFRRYAAECLRVAQETKNRTDKAMWLSLAERWDRLAESAVIRKPPTDEQIRQSTPAITLTKRNTFQ